MSISRHFEAQVEKKTNQIAVRYCGQALTYQQLNEQSNHLAIILQSKLRAYLKETNDSSLFIGLCLHPSLEMVVALLAILKSNAVVVPLDMENPPQRIQYMINEVSMHGVITEEKFKHYFTSQCNESNILVMDNKPLMPVTMTGDCAPIENPDGLAFLLYTSGSTGRPKGVMITHHSFCDFIEGVAALKEFSGYPVIDCSLSVAFSGSFQVLLAPLCLGLTISICPQHIKKDPLAYLNYLYEEKITITKFTPSFLAMLIRYIKQFGIKKNYLRMIVVAGEPFLTSSAQDLQTYFPDAQLLQSYGLTETTSGFLYHAVNFEKYNYAHFIHLGKSRANMRFYVVTHDFKLAKAGEIGELCVSGRGLSHGYWKQPTLTIQHFIQNPFVSAGDSLDDFGRLYRTGDNVLLLADGNICFVERIDQQIKIRGYRVECGEIEHAIKNVKDVQQCTVVVKKIHQQDHLVAYYTTSDTTSNKLPQSIKQALKLIFPDYMIPTYFVQLSTFPLTINDKIDKKALPLPDERYRFVMND